jgi:hypothetical protein
MCLITFSIRSLKKYIVIWQIYEMYRKVPGLGRKRNAGITYSILAAITLQNSLLGNVYSNPIVFSMLQKHCGSHFP